MHTAEEWVEVEFLLAEDDDDRGDVTLELLLMVSEDGDSKLLPPTEVVLRLLIRWTTSAFT